MRDLIRRLGRPAPVALAIAHVALLILVRAVRDADDVSQWDLISFLNAQCDSLGAVLRRPEVHFLNPFSFPIYNVGAESAVSTVLHKGFGYLSLHWSTLLVLLVYDVVFLFVVDGLFRLVLADERARAWGWLLLSTSWVTLTFASTQAFTIQAYWVIVLALSGVEWFARGRDGRGTLCLAVAFLFMSQGYALSFLIPYYTAAWALFRAVACRRPRGLRSLVVVAALVLLANLASHGAYLRKISPVTPFESGPVLADGGALVSRAILFLRQSFWPEIRVDGVSVGFAPYFLYGAALVLAAIALARRPRARFDPRDVLAVALAGGLLVVGYAPSFLNPVVKSQRAVPGEVFLALVVVLGAAALVRRGALDPGRVSTVVLACVLLSDAVYLGLTLRVDHTRNHSPIFDFDLSDGVVRHDMQAAILEMKDQVERLGGAIVIIYPRGYSENTTDPAMFHARFLRHLGRFAGRPEVIFPCRFCDASYGCPFPDLLGQECALRCCQDDPRLAIEQAQRAGRNVFLWWWKDAPRDVPLLRRESVVEGIPGATLVRVPLAPAVLGWECYRIEVRVAVLTPDEGACARAGPERCSRVQWRSHGAAARPIRRPLAGAVRAPHLVLVLVSLGPRTSPSLGNGRAWPPTASGPCRGAARAAHLPRNAPLAAAVPL